MSLEHASFRPGLRIREMQIEEHSTTLPSGRNIAENGENTCSLCVVNF
jgi:hypothetical protein